MAKINALRADLDKETNGMWVPYQMGIELKIARLGNAKYQEALRKAVEDRKVLLGVKELTDEQRQAVQKDVAAETILLDWRGVEDDDGDPLPYSAATAKAWFHDPELWRLYSFVLMQSLEEENFRKEILAAAAKN